MRAVKGRCAYCGREMWLAGLEPCCDRAEHAAMVCKDIRGCVDVVLARLHERASARSAGGPYETERDAMHASLWHTHGRDLDITKANLIELAAALSGVELGGYDKRIVDWLAGYEPSTVTVICGLISRARAQGGAR